MVNIHTTAFGPQPIRTSTHTAKFHTSCSAEDYGNKNVITDILTDEITYTAKTKKFTSEDLYTNKQENNRVKTTFSTGVPYTYRDCAVLKQL